MLRDIWEARVATARSAKDKAAALNGLTRSLLETSVEDAAAANERALRVAAAAADLRSTAEAIRNRASIALMRRDLANADSDFAMASEMAEALEHGGLWASAQIGLAAVCRLRSDFDGAIARLAKARQRARETGDPATERLAWNYLAALYLEMHDFPAADAAASACWASAEDAGDTMLALACSSQLWRARFSATAPDRCLKGLERCAAGLRALGERLMHAQILVHIGRLELQLGRSGPALQRAIEADRIADDSGHCATTFEARLLMGEVRAAQGEFREARSLIGAVHEFAEQHGVLSLRMAVRRVEARLAEQTGEIETATSLWEEIDALAFENGFWHPVLEANAALARIALAKGDNESAEGYLERRDIAKSMLEWETPEQDPEVN